MLHFNFLVRIAYRHHQRLHKLWAPAGGDSSGERSTVSSLLLSSFCLLFAEIRDSAKESPLSQSPVQKLTGGFRPALDGWRWRCRPEE